jgi:hypothetical protein
MGVENLVRIIKNVAVTKPPIIADNAKLVRLLLGRTQRDTIKPATIAGIPPITYDPIIANGIKRKADIDNGGMGLCPANKALVGHIKTKPNGGPAIANVANIAARRPISGIGQA